MLGGIGNLKTVFYNNFINTKLPVVMKNFRNIENYHLNSIRYDHVLAQ